MTQLPANWHSTDVLQVVHRSGSLRPISVKEAIASSWRRCVLDYSLDPSARHPPVVVDGSTLAERREHHEDLLRLASAEVDWLFKHIAGTGYILLLTDATGLILYSRSDAALSGAFHSMGLRVGADWNERYQGTNGMGTCIAEHSAITVHREEHFQSCHIGLSCSAAPIRDATGRLLAVLDASTAVAEDEPRQGQTHTMALVELSARLIEKCVFLRQFDGHRIVRFHTRPEFVNLQHDGALVLADDETILAADETALRLLSVTTRDKLLGRRLDEVFSTPNGVREHSLASRKLQSLHDAAGRCFYASVPDQLRGVLVTPRSEYRSVIQVQSPARRRRQLQLDDLAGGDPQMQHNVRSARRLVSTQVPVMIQGPTGAGKEVFARAMHAASPRAAQPFVALNCAAIPEPLIESELFGYRPGAFTGARREGMKGKILLASGGTLFLDEIGDMPLHLQTRLLRVLEEQEVVPLGADTPYKVDLHVICATHQNLQAMVATGRFRDDLYYRLNGMTIELPPLAQRADKEQVIRDFLTMESGYAPVSIEVDAFAALLAHSWPGNMRELRNVIRTALAICDDGVIRLRDLPSEVTAPYSATGEGEGAAVAAKANPIAAAERQVILQALQEHGGNVSRAASALQIGRNTFYRRCRRLGIELQRDAQRTF